MNYIIYSNGLFTINTKNAKLDSDSKIITHYKNTVEQLRRSHDWKSATDHVFADSYIIPPTDSYFEPQINSITSIPGDYFYYSTELDKGGGIYKKNKTNSDDEGFVFTSREDELLNFVYKRA